MIVPVHSIELQSTPHTLSTLQPFGRWLGSQHPQRSAHSLDVFGDRFRGLLRLLQAESGVQIAGRCSVFAESDMIHKQQVGHPIDSIIFGLCEALVRNFLNNLAKGKNVEAPVVFQGGVAANVGMKRAFEEALKVEVAVPEHFAVMGAIGAALLAQEMGSPSTNFKGFQVTEIEYRTSSFNCKGCSNNCEIVKIMVEGDVLARWGGRCGKWELDLPGMKASAGAH